MQHQPRRTRRARRLGSRADRCTPTYWAGAISADPERIATARLLLDQLGVTLDDLNRSNTTTTDQTASVPTLAEYLPHVIAAAGPGANRTSWQLLAQDARGLG